MEEKEITTQETELREETKQKAIEFLKKEGLKVYEPHEFEVLKTNIEKESYKSGKTAGFEIAIKEAKRKTKDELGIETDGIKSVEELIEIRENHSKSSLTKSISEKEKEWQNDKTKLQTLIEQHKKEIETIKYEKETEFKNYRVNQILGEAIGSLNYEIPKYVREGGDEAIKDYISIERQKALLLFKSNYNIDFDETGNPYIKQGENVLKDELQNPIKINDLIIPFAKKYHLPLSLEKMQGRANEVNSKENKSFKNLDVSDFEQKMANEGISRGTNKYDEMLLKFHEENK